MSAQLEVRDELRELVGGGGVAAARALAELDRAAVQRERLGSLDGADDLVEDAAEQRLVVGVRAAGGVEEGDGVHARCREYFGAVRPLDRACEIRWVLRRGSRESEASGLAGGAPARGVGG